MRNKPPFNNEILDDDDEPVRPASAGRRVQPRTVRNTGIEFLDDEENETKFSAPTARNAEDDIDALLKMGKPVSLEKPTLDVLLRVPSAKNAVLMNLYRAETGEIPRAIMQGPWEMVLAIEEEVAEQDVLLLHRRLSRNGAVVLLCRESQPFHRNMAELLATARPVVMVAAAKWANGPLQQRLGAYLRQNPNMAAAVFDGPVYDTAARLCTDLYLIGDRATTPYGENAQRADWMQERFQREKRGVWLISDGTALPMRGGTGLFGPMTLAGKPSRFPDRLTVPVGQSAQPGTITTRRTAAIPLYGAVQQSDQGRAAAKSAAAPTTRLATPTKPEPPAPPTISRRPRRPDEQL